MLDLSCPSMSIQERKLVEKRKNQEKLKRLTTHSLREEGKKLPDDKKASMLKKPPEVKKAKMPKDGNDVCEEDDYFKKVQAGVPLVQKIVAMEGDDDYEESKSDEEAIEEAFRSPVLYSTV